MQEGLGGRLRSVESNVGTGRLGVALRVSICNGGSRCRDICIGTPTLDSLVDPYCFDQY